MTEMLVYPATRRRSSYLVFSSHTRDPAPILDNFFSVEVKNHKIAEFSETDLLARNSTHSFLKPIINYRKHPSILAIKNKNDKQRLNFCRISVEEDVNDIKKLSFKLATQYFDIPVKILK